MGKRIKDMTELEIQRQRERASRNRPKYAFKSKTERLIEKIHTEAGKVKTKQTGFYFGIVFATELIRELRSK